MPRTPDARVIELQGRLIDERDPVERAHIHVELARNAMTHGQVEVAVRHLREALVHNRRLEQARSLLHDLGEATQIREDPTGRRRSLRGLVRRLRRS